MAKWLDEYIDLFVPRKKAFVSWTEFMKFPKAVLDKAIDYEGDNPKELRSLRLNDQEGLQ